MKSSVVSDNFHKSNAFQNNRVKTQQGKTQTDNDRAGNQTDRAKKSDAAQNRQQYQQRLQTNAAIEQNRLEKIIRQTDDKNTPNCQADSQSRTGNNQQVNDSRQHDCRSADCRNERGNCRQRAPQNRIGHAKNQKTDAYQNSLSHANQKRAAHHGADCPFNKIKNILVIIVR